LSFKRFDNAGLHIACVQAAVRYRDAGRLGLKTFAERASERRARARPDVNTVTTVTWSFVSSIITALISAGVAIAVPALQQGDSTAQLGAKLVGRWAPTSSACPEAFTFTAGARDITVWNSKFSRITSYHLRGVDGASLLASHEGQRTTLARTGSVLRIEVEGYPLEQWVRCSD
jgi:hypothetical protein